MSDSNKLVGPGLLGCGGLMLLVSSGVCVVSGVLVGTTSGRVSPDEAAPFILGSLPCALVSLAIVIGGIVILVSSRKATAAKPQGAFRTPQVPGAPEGPPRIEKPFPTHLLSGCAGLAALLFSCIAFGASAYFFDSKSGAEMMEEFAREDEMRGERYGLGSSYWREEAEERGNLAIGSIACGGLMLLMVLASIILAAVLYRRNTARYDAMRISASGPDAASAAGGFTPPPPSG
ncbi:MAG: hypothetical protein AB7S26_32270 [Sandaracinaceae bacterium]